MSNLSEEEIIESVKYHILLEYQGFCNIDKVSLQGLLDLYIKKSRMVEIMAEHLTTPTHGKKWVIKYFEDEVELEDEE